MKRTLKEIIALADSIRPNAFCEEVKASWVNEAEHIIQTEILLIAPPDLTEYVPYEEKKDIPLTLETGNDGIYLSYLTAMIDFADKEYAGYNNSIALFNEQLDTYAKWYVRTHKAGEPLISGMYLSAYGIAVSHGYTGTEDEWLLSLKGDRGEKGEKGDTGEAGKTPVKGVDYFTDSEVEEILKSAADANENEINELKSDIGDLCELAKQHIEDSPIGNSEYYKTIKPLEAWNKYELKIQVSVAGKYTFSAGTKAAASSMVDVIKDSVELNANEEYSFKYTPTGEYTYIRCADNNNRSTQWSLSVYKMVSVVSVDEHLSSMEFDGITYDTDTGCLHILNGEKEVLEPCYIGKFPLLNEDGVISGEQLPIDSNLSEESENAIQNKAVAAALKLKLDKIKVYSELPPSNIFSDKEEGHLFAVKTSDTLKLYIKTSEGIMEIPAPEFTLKKYRIYGDDTDSTVPTSKAAYESFVTGARVKGATEALIPGCIYQSIDGIEYVGKEYNGDTEAVWVKLIDEKTVADKKNVPGGYVGIDSDNNINLTGSRIINFSNDGYKPFYIDTTNSGNPEIVFPVTLGPQKGTDLIISMNGGMPGISLPFGYDNYSNGITFRAGHFETPTFKDNSTGKEVMLYPTSTSEVSDLSDALNGKSVFGLLTDLAKNSQNSVKTENETPLVKNCIYDLGEQTSLTLTLPLGNYSIGDYIQIDFISGSIATILDVRNGAIPNWNEETGSYVWDKPIGDIPTPEANKLYSLYCEWGRVNASEYGWRVSYKEYPV